MSVPVDLASFPVLEKLKGNGDYDACKNKILQDKYVNDVYNKIAPHFSNT